MESSIKINSISIDLVGANDEIDMRKCEPFSIRGFVSEIRARDWKKCWPFSSNAVFREQNFKLPPLSAPKSRWWRCEGCLQEISTEGNTTAALIKKDHPRTTNSCMIGENCKKTMGLEGACMKSKGVGKSSMNVSETENRDVMNGRLAELMTVFGSSDIAGVVDDAPKLIKKSKSDDLSMESDEFDVVSSESGILGINLRDNNNRIGFHPRKGRKVRLLSELLGMTKNMRSKDSLSKRESFRVRKRKLQEEEERRQPKTFPQNSYINRKRKTIGKNSENMTRSCDLEDNVVSESQSTGNRFDRGLIKGKKKNKRFQVVDEHSPVVSCGNSNKGVQENTCAGTEHHAADKSLLSSVHSAFTGGELVPCPLHAEKTEEYPTLSKERNKTLVAPKTGLLEENLITTANTSVPQSQPVDVRFQSVQDIPSILASDRCVRKHIPKVEDRPVFSLSWQDHARTEDASTNLFQDVATSSKSESDSCLGTKVVDLSSKKNGNGIPFLNPATEAANHPIMQQKDTYSAHSKGKTIMIQGSAEISSNSSDHRAEKLPDSLDDVPMEIVELMAKNQYERCLPDGEDNHKQLSEAASTSKNGLLIDLNKTYENGVSPEENVSRKSKSFSKMARKADKPTDFFPISQSGYPYFRSGFSSLPQSLEKPPSSIPWLGNVAQTAKPDLSGSAFRMLRACNTCQSVPQQHKNERNPIWTSMRQSTHMPMPQKYMDQLNKIDMFSRTTNEDPESWNLNLANHGIQKRGFDSENSFGCKKGGIKGPFDWYSYESSVPAMDLLSLMDPRLRSSTPFNMTESSTLLKRSSFSTNTTRQSPFDVYSQKFSPEISRENFPSIAKVANSASSFRNDKGFANCNGFMAQASMKYQEKKSKRKDNMSSSHKSKKPVLATGDLGKFKFLDASGSSIFRPKHSMENGGKQKPPRAQSCNTTLLPPRTDSASEICCFNRNPADFSVPEPQNTYMIKGKDLKVRKRTGFGKKTGVTRSLLLLPEKMAANTLQLRFS